MLCSWLHTTALKKKLAKSHEANNKRCLLVLDALLECDGEDPGPSGDWISSGLIHVNNVTFELYLAKNSKRCIRAVVLAGREFGEMKAQLDDEDILFYWSVLTASWDDEVAITIFHMILDMWITIRGFSTASAWVEQFKTSNKK